MSGCLDPHPSGPTDLWAAVLGQDSAPRFRIRSTVNTGPKQAAGAWAFRGEALHSWSPPDSSAVEPGEGQMGNVGFEPVLTNQDRKVSSALQGRCREIMSPLLPTKHRKRQSSGTALSGVVAQGVSP